MARAHEVDPSDAVPAAAVAVGVVPAAAAWLDLPGAFRVADGDPTAPLAAEGGAPAVPMGADGPPAVASAADGAPVTALAAVLFAAVRVAVGTGGSSLAGAAEAVVSAVAAAALAAVLVAAVLLAVEVGDISAAAVLDTADGRGATPAALAAVFLAAVLLAVASGGASVMVGTNGAGWSDPAAPESLTGASCASSAVTRWVNASRSADVTTPRAERARSTSERMTLTRAVRLLTDVLTRSSAIAPTCSAVASP